MRSRLSGMLVYCYAMRISISNLLAWVGFGRRTRNGLMADSTRRYDGFKREVSQARFSRLFAWRYLPTEFIQVGFGRLSDCTVY